ncbi:unnamed protein product, partial [Gulo gulo]
PSGGEPPAPFSRRPLLFGSRPPALRVRPVRDSAGEFHTSHVSPPPLAERPPDRRPEP